MSSWIGNIYYHGVLQGELELLQEYLVHLQIEPAQHNIGYITIMVAYKTEEMK